VPTCSVRHVHDEKQRFRCGALRHEPKPSAHTGFMGVLFPSCTMTVVLTDPSEIDSVELGGSHERVDGSCAISSRVCTGKEVVATAECDGAQGAFGAGVVDFD